MAKNSSGAAFGVPGASEDDLLYVQLGEDALVRSENADHPAEATRADAQEPGSEGFARPGSDWERPGPEAASPDGETEEDTQDDSGGDDSFTTDGVWFGAHGEEEEAEDAGASAMDLACADDEDEATGPDGEASGFVLGGGSGFILGDDAVDDGEETPDAEDGFCVPDLDEAVARPSAQAGTKDGAGDGAADGALVLADDPDWQINAEADAHDHADHAGEDCDLEADGVVLAGDWVLAASADGSDALIFGADGADSGAEDAAGFIDAKGFVLPDAATLPGADHDALIFV